MNILILGANGFIGSNLSEAILAKTDWHIYAMDMAQDKLTEAVNQKLAEGWRPQGGPSMSGTSFISQAMVK